MGTVYKATCPCGFEQFKLLQGHGMDAINYNFEIFQCDDCDALFNYELEQPVDSLFKPLRCPECKGHLSWLGGQPDKQEHLCPECHQNELVMTVIQLWD